MTSLTDQLQQRRRELYMTQRGVAKLMGLTGAAISFRERNDSDHLKTLEEWAKALGCEARIVTEGSSVICKNCREQTHQDCPGGTWCDCAHRPTAIIPAQIGLVGHPAAGVTTLAQTVAEQEDLRQAKIRAGVRLMRRLTDPSELRYYDVLQESLDLLHLDGLREAIEQRYAADELSQQTQEVFFP
jgi:transcriptional regulator with XRE-family HTH domain